MWKAVTSVVLIIGQLAMLAAAPMYICTSADGTQRLEWGECECSGSEGHSALPQHDRQTKAALPNELQLAAGPCHCEHQPLSDDVRLISRAEPGTRGALIAVHGDGRAIADCQKTANVPLVVDSTACGHTSLSDRLSICLRC